MKINCLICIAVLGFSRISFAEIFQVPCETENVFCLSEFEKDISSSKSISEAISMMPQHLKKNFTLKRGNNMSKTRFVLDSAGKQLVAAKNSDILGPHGHRVSKSNSLSATPSQPRVILWDETSGFTASWNSGNPAHSGHDRVDLYDFDFGNKKHILKVWDPQSSEIAGPSFVDPVAKKSCLKCHGDVQRPIFPMYPDWPQFYGEFNDELTGYSSSAKALRSDLKLMSNLFQKKEMDLYSDFLQKERIGNPNYSVLYDGNQNNILYSLFPFRPRTTTSPFSDVSRAFYYRPNLRLGVLYNRLVALQATEKIKQSPIFQKYPDAMLYSLLDCSWNEKTGFSTERRVNLMNGIKSLAADKMGLDSLELRGPFFTAKELKNGETAPYGIQTRNGIQGFYHNPPVSSEAFQQIPYEDLLALLGLNIADIDLRFRHDADDIKDFNSARGYSVYDPKGFYETDSVMDIGYISRKYPMHSVCDNNNLPCRFSYAQSYMQGMRYFNSYFDGSATTNELMAAQLLLYILSHEAQTHSSAEIRDVQQALRKMITDPSVYFETLEKKYSHFTERMKLDSQFFDRMDRMSPWIQLPYPPHLLYVHNRESFWTEGAKQTMLRHAQWKSFDDRSNQVRNENNSRNICWNLFDVIQKRYGK